MIVPAITFTSSAEVAVNCGALPVILDVDRDSYLLTPEIVREFIEKECGEKAGWLVHNPSKRRIRAMVPVHYGGRTCDMSGLQKIASEHDLRIVEDAAHSFPSVHDSRPVGSLGELAAFSFYATKNLTTGEGGMLTTDNLWLADRLRRMRVHGIMGQTYGRKRWKYDVVDRGFKCNLPDMNAAMGRVQLSRSAGMHERRRAISRRYREAFADLPGLRLPPDEDDTSSCHLFTVEIAPESGKTRDDFVEGMYARHVGVSLHFIPLYRHSFYRDRYGLSPENYPNSEAIYERMVSLPIYSAMSDEDLEYVVACVREIFGA